MTHVHNVEVSWKVFEFDMTAHAYLENRSICGAITLGNPGAELEEKPGGVQVCPECYFRMAVLNGQMALISSQNVMVNLLSVFAGIDPGSTTVQGETLDSLVEEYRAEVDRSLSDNPREDQPRLFETDLNGLDEILGIDQTGASDEAEQEDEDQSPEGPGDGDNE